jgi:hydantoinase/carbamoylase family amidase
MGDVASMPASTLSPTLAVHDWLDELAEFSSEPASRGVTREVFSAPYMAALEYAGGLMAQAGLAVHTDAFGNLRGRLAGSTAGASAVMAGSHIDTVPNGGRYDGALGVLGAIDAVRVLRAGGWAPQRPVEIVCFAGEQPSFGTGCLGSRAMIGELERSDLDGMRDRCGCSLADAMLAAGLQPSRLAEARIDPAEVHAFVELHIEQGTLLQNAGIDVGVVTHIAAQHSMRLTLRGQAAHAGATPMHLRRDAIAGAAEIMVELERLACQSASPATVATVGAVSAVPGAINVVPGAAELLVDIRDDDLAVRAEVVEVFVGAVAAIAARRGLSYELATISRDEPLNCSRRVIAAARVACDRLSVRCMEMSSGAVHDAMIMGSRIAAGMIFVPSWRGVSHARDEYTAPDEVAVGVRVLAETLRVLAEHA